MKHHAGKADITDAFVDDTSFFSLLLNMKLIYYDPRLKKGVMEIMMHPRLRSLTVVGCLGLYNVLLNLLVPPHVRLLPSRSQVVLAAGLLNTTL